jgi:hypothetical protein
MWLTFALCITERYDGILNKCARIIGYAYYLTPNFYKATNFWYSQYLNVNRKTQNILEQCTKMSLWSWERKDLFMT